MRKTTAYTPGQIQSWLDDGTPNHLPIYTFTAMVDPTRMLTLQDNMGGSPIGVPADISPTDWFAPWQPMHSLPPTDPTITLRLPATRVSDSFRLRHPVADGWSSQIDSYLGLDISSPIQFSGLYGMAPYSIQFDSLTLANPTPYVSGPFVLDDLTTAETHGSILHAGFNDLSDWFVPPHPVNLQISSSRQGHQLAIQHPNGEFFPIQNGNNAGSTSGPPGQPPWYQDYFYFDATAIARSEMPWYVVDNDTGERIGFAANQNHPANGALIDWIAVPPPGTLTGGINAGGNIELQWPLANLASDQGGFEVERLLTGETLWQKIGTIAASTADADNILHFTDQNPVFGKVHYYRVRYTYGSGAALRRSAPSNAVGLSGWQDDDGDGMPDWWETAHGLNPGWNGDATGFSGDADGDGISNLDEYLAGSNPNDPASCPYKVTVSKPVDRQMGHHTNSVLLLYLNKQVPAGMTTLPQGIVKHTTDCGVTWQTVSGTATVLQGSCVAFVPTADFIPHAIGVREFTYQIDFTAATTGLDPVVPLHLRFSVEDPDPVGPWVDRTWPGYDYIDVATDVSPVVQWNEPLRPDTVVPANVSLRPDGGVSDLPVSVGIDYSTNRITVAPDALLQPDTRYTVALSTGFKNLMGLPLLNVYRWSFRTRPTPPPPPPGAPYIGTIDPLPYSTNLPTTFRVNVTFSEAMDATTLTSQTIHLRSYGSSEDVPVLLTYDEISRHLVIEPQMPLANATRYMLGFDLSAILSSGPAPQPLAGQTDFTFSTVPSGGGPGGGDPGPGIGPGGPIGAC